MQSWLASQLDSLDPALQLLQRGGPIVLLLVLLSVLAVSIIIAKLLHFQVLGIGHRKKLYESLSDWRKGNQQGALKSLKQLPRHPVARVMDAAMQGLLSERSEATVREEVTRIARNHIEHLRGWLRALELIANLSPLLGLLGTVIGMIEAFRQLESAGNQVDPALLSGGIWQALLTTAVGLIVAIPALVAHQWLERKVERCAHLMEDCTTRVFTSIPSSRSRKSTSIAQAPSKQRVEL
ncbi:MAG: MotA/TolQ/ExbB proton channel family protein [Granulosicoccus sp.]